MSESGKTAWATYAVWLSEHHLKLEAELEQVKKERDELRVAYAQAAQLEVQLDDLKAECAAAEDLIAEIEAEDYWILEGQCTMQSCEANGKAIVAEARRRLARNVEMDSLEYTRK